MKQLIFKKPNKRIGEDFEAGYYWKGKFLSRYKQEALKILRKRVENLPENRRNRRDEWKLIHQEYLKQQEITKKINNKKQGYYEILNERAKNNRISFLKNKIEGIKAVKKNKMEEYDKRIAKVKEDIQKLKGGQK